MSLRRSAQEQTRAELRVNLELAGLTGDDVARLFGWTVEQVEHTLRVSGADPRRVWLVRDLADRTINDMGGTPRPWSSLTESMRGTADEWFGLDDLDEALRGTPR